MDKKNFRIASEIQIRERLEEGLMRKAEPKRTRLLKGLTRKRLKERAGRIGGEREKHRSPS